MCRSIIASIKQNKTGRLKEVMQARAHGPLTLRPFPDANAPISRSGNAARLTAKKFTFCKHRPPCRSRTLSSAPITR